MYCGINGGDGGVLSELEAAYEGGERKFILPARFLRRPIRGSCEKIYSELKIRQQTAYV
jgi:hypothetical protein